MRIIHTSDWHLGRTFFQEDLLEDQSVLLEQVFEMIGDTKADALVIAGDIFDRPNPKREAVALFDEFLTRVYRDTDAAIIAIAGNHDAPERIGFGGALQDPRRVLIRGPVGGRAEPILLDDDHGVVAISALPFSEIYAARAAFQDETISAPEQVLSHQISRARATIPEDCRWVAVAHAFVQGGDPTDSERPLTFVGGVETVSASLFDGAAYVALGHLHRPQAAGGDHIRYCGSWMGFGFDEADQEKSLNLVELGAAGISRHEKISFSPKRGLRVLEGDLVSLVRQGRREPSSDLIKVVLTDAGGLVDPMGQLREVYPHVMQVERKIRAQLPNGDAHGAPNHRHDPLGLIQGFLETVRDKPDEQENQAIAATLGALSTEE